LQSYKEAAEIKPWATPRSSISLSRAADVQADFKKRCNMSGKAGQHGLATERLRHQKEVIEGDVRKGPITAP